MTGLLLSLWLLQEALDEICSTLGDTPSAAEIRALWNEYEAGSTEEAKIVKVCACLLRVSMLPLVVADVLFVDTCCRLVLLCRTLTSSR